MPSADSSSWRSDRSSVRVSSVAATSTDRILTERAIWGGRSISVRREPIRTSVLVTRSFRIGLVTARVWIGIRTRVFDEEHIVLQRRERCVALNDVAEPGLADLAKGLSAQHVLVPKSVPIAKWIRTVRK